MEIGTPAKYSEFDIGNTQVYVISENMGTPTLSILPIMGEELNRLGDGCVYIAQSFLKLITEETVVRDWGKNFRIGVFNNRIEKNVTEYFQIQTTEESYLFDTVVPYEYDTIEIQATKPVKLNDTVVNSNIILGSEFVEDKVVSFAINKIDSDDSILTLRLKLDNEIIWEEDYHILFNAAETSEITEVLEDSTDYEALTDDEIFEYAGYWSNPLTQVNEIESCTVQFDYDETLPLYILFTQDYRVGNPRECSLQFTSPIIAESDNFSEGNVQCVFPYPIRAILHEDDELSSLELNSFQTSNGLRLTGFDIGDIQTDDTMAVLGVEVKLNVELSDDIIIFATLIDPNGNPGTRSILLDSSDVRENKIVLGGPYDLWGFSIDKMVNLDQWKLELSFSNPFTKNDLSQILCENVELIFYVNQIDEQVVLCKVNGKDTRHYGMFLDSVDIPTGLKTDVKYLEIDGSDINDAYRQNIDKKEITIDFSIQGCTIQETTSFLKMIGKLFTNQRDELNRPIPNRIEFSHYPDEYWNVILEDPIDSDVEDVAYSSTIKLIVPDGTSYNVDETVTSVIGNCNSIAKVNPVIALIPDISSESFEIHEIESDQHMTIEYSKFIEGDVCELDCNNRILLLKRYSEELSDIIDIDISDAVSWNADWFSLYGAYNFESKNCMIQTVSFVERG